MNDLAPFQAAVFSALTATPATYPVYDAVPQGTTAYPVTFPYIVIGAFSALPDDELGAPSTDAALMLHGWSKAVTSKAQSHAIAQFIRARLDNVILGGAWTCEEDMVEVMEDPASTAASRLYHAAIRYRVRVG